MNNFNSKRLETTIHRYLTDIFQKEIKNPQLKQISLVEVRLNKDKSIANVYYSFIGDIKQKTIYSELLDKNVKTIRQKLAQKLKIFKVPQLRFKYDTSLSTAQRVEQILNQVKKTSAFEE